MKAQLINHDGETLEVEPINGKDFQLAELQGMVNGNIEIVDLNDDIIMVINEEGQLLNLPINHTSTCLYQMCVGVKDVIVGDVLLCGSNQVL